MLLYLQVGLCFVRVQWLEQSLGDPLVLSHYLKNCSKAIEACSSTKIMSFDLDLALNAISAVCHQFGLFSIDLQLILYASFVVCRDCQL